MKIIPSTQEIIKRALTADTDPINRARLHILFYTMSISAVFTAMLGVIYALHGPPLQFIRIIIVFVATALSLYKMLSSHNHKPAAHIVMMILNMLVWSNVFILIQAINIVTIQYVILAITCSFYLLEVRWGMFYSILVMLPILLHFILNGTGQIQIFVTDQQASNPVFLTVMLFNFFLLIFINYHFLRAFHFAIVKLKEAQSDEKMLNEKLKEAIAIAEASSKAKSDFLSTMSHELRTPLNSVIGMSYVLLADNPRADQEDNLKVLHFSAGSLLSLINDILDFNKLEYGKIELENIRFNPAELIKSIYSGLKYQAEEKGLEFTLMLDDKLKEIELNGDPTRLLQVLFNLVGNAIKFTPKGRVDLSVEVTDSQRDCVSLKFTVADTGIGISAEHRSIIFEPFSQASSNITRKFGGTGLGLAITKQLLELHESNIQIDSEEGKGTVFKFIIKYSRAAQEALKESTAPVSHLSNHADLSELRILVAEDNAMNILLMKKIFSSWNITADFVVNGSEAVDMALQNGYDIILMDIHMPVMDGYEASRKILDSYDGKDEKPWIIALTASVAIDIHKKVEDAGMDDYLSKPFNPPELKSKLGLLSALKAKKISQEGF